MLHRRTTTAVLAALAVTACNDDIDLDRGWEADVDTVTLYTVERPEYQGMPAAFDINARHLVRIEEPGATGSWDFALTGGVDGPLALTPLGAFFEVESNAGVATVQNRTFEELEAAPSDDDAFVTDSTVALVDDVIYVIRSRMVNGCMNFAKVDPLVIDQTAGSLTFQVTANPTCNDRALVPPEDD